jgi:glycine/D-amino acid oxidase-like deaminating enzyme
VKILVVGTGGVGAAVAAVAQRRDFFERITFADLHPARPQRSSTGSATTASPRPRWTHPINRAWGRWHAITMSS